MIDKIIGLCIFVFFAWFIYKIAIEPRNHDRPKKIIDQTSKTKPSKRNRHVK